MPADEGLYDFTLQLHPLKQSALSHRVELVRVYRPLFSEINDREIRVATILDVLWSRKIKHSPRVHTHELEKLLQRDSAGAGLVLLRIMQHEFLVHRREASLETDDAKG